MSHAEAAVPSLYAPLAQLRWDQGGPLRARRRPPVYPLVCTSIYRRHLHCLFRLTVVWRALFPCCRFGGQALCLWRAWRRSAKSVGERSLRRGGCVIVIALPSGRALVLGRSSLSPSFPFSRPLSCSLLLSPSSSLRLCFCFFHHNHGKSLERQGDVLVRHDYER